MLTALYAFPLLFALLIIVSHVGVIAALCGYKFRW
jgi:hypothetical protein